MENTRDRVALLGLDIGTTHCKLVAYSTDGEILGEGGVGYSISEPELGRAELEPSALLDSVTNVFLQVAPSLKGIHKIALAISSQGEAFLPINQAGQPLIAAPISIDRRGQEAIAVFNEQPAVKKACTQAGQKLTMLTSLAKLLWMKAVAPDIFAKTTQILCLGEYVIQALGVVPKIDCSMAARMGLLDNFQWDWSQELLRLAGLPASLLPPVVFSGTYIGTVAQDKTQNFGLTVPIHIYAGGHDQACAFLGAGLTGTEAGLYSIGTTEGIAFSLDQFRSDWVAQNFDIYSHVVARNYMMLIGNQSGGRLLEWWRTIRRIPQTEDLFDNMPDCPSEVTILPHFAGSGSVLADEQALGVIAGLSFETTPSNLTHAFLEGITFEQASALAKAKDLGLCVKKLRAVGKGTKSRNWMQIKADIMGMPIECIHQGENSNTGSCAGAAILAGLGCGVLPSLNEALLRFSRIGFTYYPRSEFTEIYTQKLKIYHQIYRTHQQHPPLMRSLKSRIDALKAGFATEA